MENLSVTRSQEASLDEQFRWQKKNNAEEVEFTDAPPKRKRLLVLTDSDSDNDTNTKPDKILKFHLSVSEKEDRFLSASKIVPDYDSMDIQDSLVRCNWDVSLAIRYLKDHFKPTASLSNGECHVQDSFNYKKQQTQLNVDVDKMRYSKRQVYDSDESDYENSNELTLQRKEVLHFMNNASFNELLTVKSCSEKKANIIIGLRPFNKWSDLSNALQSQKYVSGDILNYCQDLLNKQSNVTNIMAKCNKLVEELEKAIENGADITEQPKILNKNLKLAEYQLIGLNWLAVMHQQKMNGILADEMGLGKTIQVIALLAYLKEEHLALGAHLIIVPSSTLDNWEDEIRKWCEHLTVEKYYGSQEERRSLRIKYAKQRFIGIDILLTTYHMVSSTPEERKMFRTCKFHYVIFDEAHMLKNMTTQRYSQLITINAERRLLLTGTPLQNNLLELMSLLCFVMPSFFSKAVEDIKSLFKQKGQKNKDDESIFEQKQIEPARRIMKPFVLRRFKKDVLNCLPNKTEYIEKIPMIETQKCCYNELVEYYSSNSGVIKGNNETAGCTIMMEMRRLANHPLLMRYYYKDDNVRKIAEQLSKTSYKKKNVQYIFEDLAYLSDFQIYQICEKYEIKGFDIPEKLILESGKFKKLDQLLPALKKDGHRVLIFSQFTMMLDILEKYLVIRNHNYFRLDGTTAVTERQQLIDQFNSEFGIFVFLLSTKAGGMGINLTAADTAIIHDIDFNPYNDKQAEDRCHRIGQKKSVTIYRLISEGTIEEGMLLVAQEKLKLEKEINSENDDVQEHKCMVRLLTMALGLDTKRAEDLLSPQKPF